MSKIIKSVKYKVTEKLKRFLGKRIYITLTEMEKTTLKVYFITTLSLICHLLRVPTFFNKEKGIA